MSPYSTDAEESGKACVELCELFEHRPLKNYSMLSVKSSVHVAANRMPPMELIEKIAAGDDALQLVIIGKVSRYLAQDIEGAFRKMENEPLKNIPT